MCRARLPDLAPGQEGESTYLWGGVTGRTKSWGGSIVKNLCDQCRWRNEQARGATMAEQAQEVARSAQQCADWLRGAPLLDELPARPGSFAELFPPVPFVEVMGLRTAADKCARGLRGLAEGFRLKHAGAGPNVQPPTTYRNVLFGWQREEAGHLRPVTGSVYRLADGDVVLHWHTQHHFSMD